jgi:hypothetical protein
LTAHGTDDSYLDKSELPDDPVRKLTHHRPQQRRRNTQEDEISMIATGLARDKTSRPRRTGWEG